MQPEILVGTASWQEPDFIEFWYPKSLPKTRLLEYYADHFNFVEVNGTFYGIPQAKTVAQWSDQTPNDFIFDVKLHRLLSRHATEPKFLPSDLRDRARVSHGKVELDPDLERAVAQRFLEGVQPLIGSKKLGAFLLQLSPSFQAATHRLDELNTVLEFFSAFPLAVELRSRDWLTGPQAEQTVNFFKARKITLVSVDAPTAEHRTIMPNIDFVTNPQLGYFRAHGRNAQAYIKGRTVQTRFDYEYTDEELLELAQRITGVGSEVQAVHAVLNNNRRDFAPKAALRLKEILEKRLKQKVKKTIKKQETLL